jgi:hypothetical protein
VRAYAEKADAGPIEALRTLWDAVAEETLQRRAGGQGALSEPAILLLALCEYARHLGSELQRPAQSLAALQEATLRVLWGDAEVIALSARPSPERGLERSPAREPEDGLRAMPSSRGAYDGEGSGELRGLPITGEKARHVSEALSALEEVWRSIADKGQKGGIAKRLRGGANALLAARCLPLARGVPNRVGTLRGAGNAIVPQAAAEVIAAFMEVTA